MPPVRLRPASDDEPESDMADQIMDLVRTTVEPDSWRETGGGEGALRELNGQLIVYNTSEAHQQVRSLLSQLREARARMVAVEARYLMVGSNFLEEIGVDLDFVFNSASAGFDPAFNTQGAPITDPFSGAQVLIPRPYSQIGLMPAIPPGLGGGTLGSQVTPVQPYGHPGFVPTGTGIIPHFSDMTPITAQQGSYSLADPRSLATGIPGTFAREGLTPALTLAGSFLDNLQVDFLIRATQANKRSSIVQAPRVMMWNGGAAQLAVTRTRQYVSSVTPSVAEGAVGVQPVLQAAPSGTSLWVSGAISADRRYVTLEVSTQLADEPSFERFEVQRASGNSPGIFILLPDRVGRSVRTMVSVPDGGTVLLGGLKQVGEIEVEAGVPILSKIPILKRAFTNTTMVKDTQTLLILLKAKILIQKEAEEEAFPTLSSLSPG
jgi:general secretion pathway protein D